MNTTYPLYAFSQQKKKEKLGLVYERLSKSSQTDAVSCKRQRT